jgi:hypothetical protein
LTAKIDACVRLPSDAHFQLCRAMTLRIAHAGECVRRHSLARPRSAQRAACKIQPTLPKVRAPPLGTHTRAHKRTRSRAHMHTRAHMHARTYTYARARGHAAQRALARDRVRARVRVCVSVCVYVCMCARACVSVRARA